MSTYLMYVLKIILKSIFNTFLAYKCITQWYKICLRYNSLL